MTDYDLNNINLELKQNIIVKIKEKPAIEDLAFIIEQNQLFFELFDIVNTEKSAMKYTATKTVKWFSEYKPELIYPFYYEIVSWLNSDNQFIKWDAIMILSYLAAVDTAHYFDKIYEEYFALIRSHQMITASNVVKSCWRFVLAQPELDQDMTLRLLEVPQLTYIHKNKVSEECNCIVCGNVLESFDHYFHVSQYQSEMIDFAKEQLNSSRRAVVQKAKKFLRKHEV